MQESSVLLGRQLRSGSKGCGPASPQKIYDLLHAWFWNVIGKLLLGYIPDGLVSAATCIFKYLKNTHRKLF